MQIAHGKVVTFHYTLRDSAGEMLDTSAGGEPLPYLHGAENIVPGLERRLAGRGVGDSLVVIVPPAEGYGEREGEAQPVPRQVLPPGLDLHPGMQLVATDEEGNPVPVWITQVSADEVWVDLNHPLADVELHFEVHIVAIRDASLEELERGHPDIPGQMPLG